METEGAAPDLESKETRGSVDEILLEENIVTEEARSLEIKESNETSSSSSDAIPLEDKIVTEEAQKLEIKESNETGARDDKIESSIYTKLLEMESWALVPNSDDFECVICMEQCKAFSGIVLRDCLHSFCQQCLIATVQHSEEPTILCPANDCSGTLQESEIRTLVTQEEYQRWLDRSLLVAEKSSLQTFHCCMRDCIGWAYCDPEVKNFPCPVCENVSCVPCKAIHEGESCVEHQLRHCDGDTGSQVILGNLIASGEAMQCPECTVVITKSFGCDWIQFSACKTEICWVTRGHRWGPRGRGDTTGGCRCRHNQGMPCHPACGNCH